MSVYASIATGAVTNGVTVTADATWREPGVKVRIYRGARTTRTPAQAFGALATGTGTATPSISANVTGTGTVLAAIFMDGNLRAPSASTGMTNVWTPNIDGTEVLVEMTANTTTTGATAIGYTETGTTAWSGVAVEIVK